MEMNIKIRTALASGFLMAAGISYPALAAAPAPEKSAAAPIHLVMAMRWQGAAIQQTMNSLLQIYNRTHPGVSWSLVPGVTSQKLLAEIAAGNPPNVAILNTTDYVGTFAAKGVIEPLTPWIRKTHLNMGQFTRASLYSNSLLGQQYAMPFFEDTYALYYNKTLFARVGIKQPPQTLQQLLIDARKLTRTGPDGQYTQLGFMPSFVKNAEAYLFGGRLSTPSGQVTADSPSVARGVGWLVDVWKAFNPQKLARFMASNAGAASSLNPFTAGKVGMMISGEWFMPSIIQEAPHLNYGVAPIPYPAGHPQYRDSGSVGGNPMVIPADASNQAEAWNLIQWMATKGERLGVQPKYFANILAVPALKGLVNDPALAGSPQMAFFWKYSQGPNITPFPPIPDAVEYEQALGNNIQLAEMGKESVAAALHTVQDQMAPLVAQELKDMRS